MSGWGKEVIMRGALRRFGRDVKERRNLDAYVVAGVAFVFALLSVVGDSLSNGPRWAVLLAGVGLLVYRITIPEGSGGTVDDVLNDRSAFEDKPFPARLRAAREVWVFAPSAVNLLAPHHCDTIRTTVLANPVGAVRVVVLNPREEYAVRLAIRQLDDSLDHPFQVFRSSLEATINQLRRMAGRDIKGSFEYRLLDYNPGFSLVALDPGTKNGIVIVEFHGFHNEVTTSRMHIELTRSDSEHWYAYWLDQFDDIWQAARPPSPIINPQIL
jgi:hypothetical protein